MTSEELEAERLADAMRGVMWTRKNRAFLGIDPYDPELKEIREEAARWLDLPEPKPYNPGPWDGEWPKNPVGLGTYGWKYDHSLIHEAVRLGVGMIDTGESYGYGKVERELGKALASYEPVIGSNSPTGVCGEYSSYDGAVIGEESRVSVCGEYSSYERESGRKLGSANLPPSPGPWVVSKVARNHLTTRGTYNAGRRSRESIFPNSARPIDLYLVHWPVPELFAETFDGLARLLEEKVILRVGVSNFSAGLLIRAVELARERGFRIVANEIRLNREDPANARYLAPFCRRLGIRVIAYSPFAQRSGARDGPEELRWVLTQGADYVVPATNNVIHLRQNVSGRTPLLASDSSSPPLESPRRARRRSD